ncbi:hypothetical protein GS597_12105 [Synechococcales cyanobacterium C]|uniref:DUF4164 domain-containing protein n=1 Tax=Petrachloros mirabilis ULC683 TaxID=2781853 RepID=A0A8K2A8S5_9CYAN|nr:hypothetical protein [Petrachloros mirabilis]NCJ07235.1 hypothetical protein [Petrachloros mirabilis ULC683]
MTPTAPDRLDRIEAAVEQIVTRLDSIGDDVTDLKISVARMEARTDERLKAVEDQISELRIQVRGQDVKLWGAIAALFIALMVSLTKLAFFPCASL